MFWLGLSVHTYFCLNQYLAAVSHADAVAQSPFKFATFLFSIFFGLICFKNIEIKGFD